MVRKPRRKSARNRSTARWRRCSACRRGCDLCLRLVQTHRRPKLAGARAGGGPVRTGLPYLVNENTPRSEWFVPSQSGGILNVSQAQSAFRSYLGSVAPGNANRSPDLARLHRGAQGLRAASLAVLATSALAAPAAVQPVHAGSAGNSGRGEVRVEINGGINIQVPSSVSDPEAIADLVSDRIGQRVAATMSASFSGLGG